MNAADLIRLFPTVYHMAQRDAWPSIRRHGLLSTRSLVEMYEPSEGVRRRLLNQVRADSVTLTHPIHGSVVIRDQRPAKFLSVCLTEDTTEQQYLDALNQRVYFWPSKARLESLLRAKAYRNDSHVVLHIDTAALVQRYQDRIELAPYNTGSMHVPTAPRRGRATFAPIKDYPFDAWLRKRGKPEKAVVEVTVLGVVADIEPMAKLVELREPHREPQVLWIGAGGGR